jgi:hypothetical protein
VTISAFGSLAVPAEPVAGDPAAAGAGAGFFFLKALIVELASALPNTPI